MVDIIDELRQTAGNLINGVIDDGEVPVSMLTEAADEIERLRAPAQSSLPPLVDRAELVALLEDLASVNLSPDACSRQASRMADDLIARGMMTSVTSTDRS